MAQAPAMARMSDWRDHAALAPFRRWLARIAADAPPAIATLNDWANESGLALPDGRALRFESRRIRSALDYERTIDREALVPVRERHWHDAFNALCWLAFPRTKGALNRLHVASPEAPTPGARSRDRDFATLIDESGLLLACDDASLVELLRAHAWRELFVERASDIPAHLRVAAIGHGLLDKLRRPYRALTAKTLVLDVVRGALWAPDDWAAFDANAVATLDAGHHEPGVLAPLPVAALPGWDTEQLGARLFDDASVFRSKVLR